MTLLKDSEEGFYLFREGNLHPQKRNLNSKQDHLGGPQTKLIKIPKTINKKNTNLLIFFSLSVNSMPYKSAIKKNQLSEKSC